jgi:hypothetical protein
VLVSVAISCLALFVVPTPDDPDAHFRPSDFEGEPVDVEQLALWVEAGDNLSARPTGSLATRPTSATA